MHMMRMVLKMQNGVTMMVNVTCMPITDDDDDET
jgi:hypothetical protein